MTANCSLCFELVQPYVDAYFILWDSIAFLLNSFVFRNAIRLYKNTDDPINLFLGSMTFADLLVTGIGIPAHYLQLYNILNSVVLCNTEHITFWLGLTASAMSLCLLNVDKWLFFRWPLHYYRILTAFRQWALVSLVWVLCVGFVGFVWFAPGIVSIEAQTWDQQMLCTFGRMQKPWYHIYMVVFCIIPIISCACLSSYLCYLIRHMNSNQDCLRRKAFVFIFATTAWTTVSLLPNRLYNVIGPAFGACCDVTYIVQQWVAWLLYYSVLLNPIINPVITVSIYAPYRGQFFKFIRKILRCCKILKLSRTNDCSEVLETNL